MHPDDVIKLLDLIGNAIIAVKLHADMFDSTEYAAFIDLVVNRKYKYDFLIIEDGKFADIETIMLKKVENVKPADSFTMHAIAGLSILANSELAVPGIVVAEMSSANTMIDNTYFSKVIQQIRKNYEIGKTLALAGLVCQTEIPKIIKPFEMLTMSPGVNLDELRDSSNQQYSIPDISRNRVGLFWIVGRGITKYYGATEELLSKMEEYRVRGWDYFLKY